MPPARIGALATDAYLRRPDFMMYSVGEVSAATLVIPLARSLLRHEEKTKTAELGKEFSQVYIQPR